MADFGSESEGERASDEIVAERMCTASEIEKKEVDNSERIESDLKKKQDDNSERIESDLNSLNASSDLLALKVSELRKRAEAAGVDLEKVDEAGDDEKNPKDKMILLIKEAEAVRSSENDKLRGLKLQEEMQVMKMSQLRLRAAEAGVSPERIDEANDDEKDPKQKLILLIIDAETFPNENRKEPHAKKQRTLSFLKENASSQFISR